MALILFILYIGISMYSLKANIDSKNEEILIKLERILAVPILTQDYVMIVDLIDAETRTSNLDFIWISDSEENIIACNDENQIMMPIAKRYRNDPTFKEFRMKNGGIISILPNYGIIFDIGSTIMVGTAISLSLLISILIIFSFRLASSLSTPIKKVVDATASMADGIFEISIPESPIAEIDEMTSSLTHTSYILKELTESLKREKELFMQSENKYRALFDNSMDAFIISDLNRGFVACNSAAVKLFNCRNMEHLLSLHPAELSPENQPDGRISFESSKEMIILALKKGSYFFEWNHKRFNGKEFLASVLLTRMTIDDNVVVQATIRDITEQKKAEEDVRQTQKMETIGTLAGGLAHDFNNVLGGIMGTLSVLRFKMNKKSGISENDLLKYLDTIEQSGNRATDMVQQLLALSRKRELSLAPVDLNLTIKHVIKICENSFDKSIKLKPIYRSEPAIVKADPTQIEQVLLNFCVNAGHAMTIMRDKDETWGGELSVSIEPIKPGPHFLKRHAGAKLGKYWLLSVKDNGIGMNKETVDKIFDPFFTTKATGVGTGLGLSMAYAIIKQHNGFMTVYSEVKIGTTFNLYLPLLEKGTVNDEEVAEEKILPKGHGLILVVDDEQVMRELAKDILEECGYSVVFAEDGKKGVELYRKIYKEVKLVLLDMIMPELSGKDAYVQMKEINPDIKVVLASGFRQDERVDTALELGVNSFIQKPYTINKLAETIDKIIANREKTT